MPGFGERNELIYNLEDYTIIIVSSILVLLKVISGVIDSAIIKFLIPFTTYSLDTFNILTFRLVN